MINLDDIQEGDSININVSARHPLYSAAYDMWETCRDFYEGEDAVKQRGEKYLPQLNGQTKEEYRVYKNRGMLFNGTGRTVEAYRGMIGRKLPIYNFTHDGEASEELNEYMQQFLERITYDGMNLDNFAHKTIAEVIVTNRVGILVDMPATPDIHEGYLSLLEYESLGMKPLLSMYKTETIINWHTEIVDGRVTPVFFVLYEPQEVITQNTFDHTIVDRFRILYLQNYNDSKNRFYKQVVVEGSQIGGRAKKERFTVKSVKIPLLDGKPLRNIPFYIFTDKGLDFKSIHKPMIYDLVKVNQAHWRNSCDLENELHFVSLKTIFIAGYDKKMFGDIKVGGAMAIPMDSTVQLVEPSSDSSLAQAMTAKEAQMAILGAERISQKGRYLPSSEVARITASTETSTLQDLITYVSLNFTTILQFVINWAKPAMTEWKGDLEATMEINSDFDADHISGADLLNFGQALLNGSISYDTYFNNLERREIYPQGWTKEKEWDRILKTQEMIMGSRLNAGEKNPFFEDEDKDAEERNSEKQTATSGKGADVTTRPLGDKARVRIS